MANFRVTEQTTVKEYMNWLETADDEDGILISTEEDQKNYFNLHKKINKMKIKIKE